MFHDLSTSGMVTITKTANGFIVALPRKMHNPYSGLAGGMMPALRKIRGEEDDVLSSIKEKSEEPDQDGYEMSALGNVFVFTEWLEVLAFLQKELS